MSEMDGFEILFVGTAFLFQIVLIIHFAIRKWRFQITQRYGWLVYALSLPAALVSIILLLSGMSWSFWLAGFIYLIWAIFGYRVEYIKQIRWRNPPYWPILGPYVLLYLATIMFYWWPLGLFSRTLWFIYGLLFVISTILNIASHKGPEEVIQGA